MSAVCFLRSLRVSVSCCWYLSGEGVDSDQYDDGLYEEPVPLEDAQPKNDAKSYSNGGEAAQWQQRLNDASAVDSGE